MFYLTTDSTHFIYGYMASDIWLRAILIVRKETRCRHIGYSYRLTARVLLYAPSHRQDNTYHGLCYTSRGALGGAINSSMGPPHEGSIRRPTAPWANALPLSYVPLRSGLETVPRCKHSAFQPISRRLSNWAIRTGWVTIVFSFFSRPHGVVPEIWVRRQPLAAESYRACDWLCAL